MSTSTDASEIKKLFKIAEIIEEIKLLYSEDHGVTLPVMRRQSSMNHHDYASFLAKCRKKVFGQEPGMKDEIIESINDEYVIDDISHKEDRYELLQEPIFSLSSTVQSMPGYNDKFCTLRAPVAED